MQCRIPVIAAITATLFSINGLAAKAQVNRPPPVQSGPFTITHPISISGRYVLLSSSEVKTLGHQFTPVKTGNGYRLGYLTGQSATEFAKAVVSKGHVLSILPVYMMYGSSSSTAVFTVCIHPTTVTKTILNGGIVRTTTWISVPLDIKVKPILGSHNMASVKIIPYKTHFFLNDKKQATVLPMPQIKFSDSFGQPIVLNVSLAPQQAQRLIFLITPTQGVQVNQGSPSDPNPPPIVDVSDSHTSMDTTPQGR